MLGQVSRQGSNSQISDELRPPNKHKLKKTGYI